MRNLQPLYNIKKLPRTLFGFYRKRRTTKSYANSIPLILDDLQAAVQTTDEALEARLSSELKHALVASLYLEHRSNYSPVEEVLKVYNPFLPNTYNLPDSLVYELSFFFSVPEFLSHMTYSWHRQTPTSINLPSNFSRMLIKATELSWPLLKKLNIGLDQFCSDLVHYYMQHHSSFWKSDPDEIVGVSKLNSIPFSEQLPILSSVVETAKNAAPDVIDLLQDWLKTLNVTNEALAEAFLRESITKALSFDEATGFYTVRDVQEQLKNIPLIRKELEDISSRLTDKKLSQFSMFCLGVDTYKRHPSFYSYFLANFMENTNTKNINRSAAFQGEIERDLLHGLSSQSDLVIQQLEQTKGLNKEKVRNLQSSIEFRQLMYQLLDSDEFFIRLEEKVKTLGSACCSNIKSFINTHKETLEKYPALFKSSLDVTDPITSLIRTINAEKLKEIKESIKFNSCKDDLKAFLAYLKMGPGSEINMVSQAVLIYVFSTVIVELQAALSAGRNAYSVTKKDLAF